MTLGTGTIQNYSYNTTYPDRLVNFNGTAISYNTLHCPSTVGNYNYTWGLGRLRAITRGSSYQPGARYENCAFTYDAYGRRTKKVYTYDNNVSSSNDYSYRYETTYQYDHSGRLIREFLTEAMTYSGGGSNTREFMYLYDESGIIGVLYSINGAEAVPYYYRRNAQGDVIAIYDADGNRKVEYAYDAFGNCSIIYGTTHDLAKRNPIRYRGYYYDRETNLYYLNARYYNPEWRRFISPDSTDFLDPESVNGLNLYCYCGNDPVNYADPTGHSWEWSIFWNGLSVLVTAIGAIALSATTFGAGIPLAMSIVAGVTLGAGVLAGINGIATMIEAGTNYNFVRDGMFNDVLGLNDSAYDLYDKITGGVAIVGGMVLGAYHLTGHYKAAKASQDYLGKGYLKAEKNRWVSKDGFRQVRWDTTHHMYKGKPSSPHFNWYKFKYPISPGVRNKLIEDVHIWLKLFSYYT